ncbi:MAG: cell surface protein [Verrucomicrobia bacterium CG_4_10_14_3_um_filter_43_23]|nr:MAG: hypothetical protein AUJ82_06940 [Verrucomicrobia bacterium CG1_02_43_26]PIP59874.1 MAG: cell surface protein [Verrucomicrobia bacterium CG22_combo_CG10-13_8_21_14_all_43_17]PIX58425.1 MAG: cell surface protein [Verrucomicrobia bacterium CG_4_10_14_3_um_filter_43_23]PIY61572.1 MAG: cell surface protein [Verrucomicrobia bacterium CG_4_10_14_0_8_um_filter_43_34]PJA43649.1 MAG: cell surface protein [Verrucomicrobia bacterium CG_4_9_14_3_um_filter_43_20]
MLKIMKRKSFLNLPLFATVGLLAGCGTTVSNLTPKQVPQNPSGIYAMSMSTHIPDADVIRPTVESRIVIDGQEHPMSLKPGSRNIYVYEYDMPEDQNEAKYYYLINYDVLYGSKSKPKELKSELYEMQLINRYVITMDTSRAPVGARISIVGRGFTEFDKIAINGVEADTFFTSPNSLMFIVPSLEANQSYPVSLISGTGNMHIGSLRIDPSSIQVNQKKVEVAQGEKMILLFQIDHDAPKRGLMIDVTTDVPDSVIMQEVIIPEGARTVSATIEGGEAGAGKLFITAPGFKETVVPVTVADNYVPEQFNEDMEMDYVPQEIL